MPRLSPLAVSLAISLAACIASSAAQAQSIRLFSDWQAACDNLRSCSAIGMGPLDADSYGFIELRRSGAAGAQTRASLAFTFETELQELPLELFLEPPGPDNALPRNARAEISPDGLLRLELPTENLTALLAALRRADVLRVRRLDDAPKDQASTTISLKGAVAALRWIDEQQMRNGNVTALVARGDRPASAIPAPPSPPAIARASYQVRQIEAKAPPDVAAAQAKACPDVEADSKGEEIGYQLTPDIVLWQMPCSRGAYNFASVFLLQPRSGAPRLIQFERPDNSKLVSDMTEIVNGEFSEEDRAIFFFSRGRGVGDCGARGAYVWDGRAFMLANWREMMTCRGAPLDLWPVIWRAETRGR